MSHLKTSCRQIAEWLQESRTAIAFTGAGISTESGLPDFRSPNGIWANNRTVYFEEFLRSESDRYEYWRQKSQMQHEFEAAQPNLAHRVLADWEASGHLHGVITQNIDGLHQLAGNQAVWQLHGTAKEIACLDCKHSWPAAHWVQFFLQEDRIPDCPDCGGLLKHATISFGQSLPEDVIDAAFELARKTDLCFVLGSSLVVYPAAGIPEVARQNGAKLVIINNTETPLDHLADVIIREPLGTALTQIHEYHLKRV